MKYQLFLLVVVDSSLLIGCQLSAMKKSRPLNQGGDRLGRVYGNVLFIFRFRTDGLNLEGHR